MCVSRRTEKHPASMLVCVGFRCIKSVVFRTCLIEDVVDGGTTAMETVGFGLVGRVGSLEFELMHWL